MTTAPTNASAEVTATDTTGRWPLLLLIGSAIKWLVLGGILSLIASIQLVRPSFLADCSVFTHGRTVAMEESVFIYGWAANAGLAIALWVLGRLGGAPLRALNWIVVGTIFWNVAVTLGLIGIATGDATSIVFLELPRYVQPLMLFAYATIGIGGVLAWVGRRTECTYAAQWYAVAALFLFPWLFSAAQVMLLWSPVRGVLQAVAGGWFAQGAWTLWLAPLGLTGAYYIVPKITGRALPSYEFAPHAFWCLLVIGAWTGGRHLVGGPVPAWIASVSIVACALLLFHYFVVFINLRGALGGGGTALKFISFGLMAYVIGGLLDAITAFRDVAVETQFTMVDLAQRQLAIYGGVSMMFFGAIYYMVPRLIGIPWSSAGLVVGHRIIVKIGVVVLVISLAVAGWNQGRDLLDPKMIFSDIADHMGLQLLVAVAAQAMLLLANLLFAVNFFQTLGKSCLASAPVNAALFREPSAMEAPAS
jgi:cytochrome c oxidase cbb3-type subunit 1